MEKTLPEQGRLNVFLNGVERAGNKLPHITMLFIYALFIVWLLSYALSFIQFGYKHPTTGEAIRVLNMLTPKELVIFLTNTVKNFMNFPPLGITIVATLGIGVAEGSGFIHVALKKLLSVIPKVALTPAVIFVSILCHVASDSAYVVLMPVSALMFYCSGRHPLAGIAASFAGLAGGFTASYTPSMIDPVMQSFTQSAARIIDPAYNVNVLCNYFFALGGTFAVIAVCWYITDKIVEPRLIANIPLDAGLENDPDVQIEEISEKEGRAFRWASSAMLLMLVGLAAWMLPADSLLRSPSGSLTSPDSPAMQCIVPFLFIFFSVPGMIHGVMSGKFNSTTAVVQSMESITRSLIGFMVFAFFCAQFLYVFGKSGIGTLIAISGAEFLKSMAMPSGLTLFGIILLTGMLNILITSATSKWAILAPIFVPMLMMLGISPELTQAAFRVSDSAVNVSTPLFPFYPLLILYCQKYYKNAGVGTLCSMMLPYSVGLLVVLTTVLYIYWGFNVPLGFDSGYSYPR